MPYSVEKLQTKIAQDSATSVFVNRCSEGDLDAVKWIIDNCPDLDVHYKKDIAFIYACEQGQTDVIEYLLDTFPNIDVHVDNDNGYISCICNCHLEAAQLLITRYPEIDDSIDANMRFIDGCETGNVDVAKWVLSRYPQIDIHTGNDSAFKTSCECGDTDVTEWLVELTRETSDGTQYYLTRDDDIPYIVNYDSHQIWHCIHNAGHEYIHFQDESRLPAILSDYRRVCQIRHTKSARK